MLAIYAGISILGDGLHVLVPEANHHHHHGAYVAVMVFGSRHEDHHVGSSGNAALAERDWHESTLPDRFVTATNYDVDSHTCEICAFLFQAVSQPAQLAAPIEWQPLVVAASNLPQPIYSPTILGPQVARGPPLLG